MNWRIITHLLGYVAWFTGAAMLPCLGIALFVPDDAAARPLAPAVAFGLSIGLSLLAGAVLLSLGRARNGDRVQAADGFAVAALGWVLMATLGAVPYLLLRGGLGLGVVEAIFESMSGFTTTGSSVFGTALADGGFGRIESLPKALLFWRSLTHWVGGMGIVVLVLAVLPALRAGGYQLFQAELPGPTAERLQPRIRETAAILWGVYFLLSAAETLLLWLGGMPLFDALCHTFATMATGGFSTKDASIGHYAAAGHPAAAYFEAVVILFMFLAGCNFLLHYRALHGSLRGYARSAEFRLYAGLLAGATVLFAVLLRAGGHLPFAEAARASLFQVVSITTTTGFATADTNAWPVVCRLGLLALMFAGGCAGSTGGGLKQVRIYVALKYGLRELRRLLRPQMVNPLRVDRVTLEERLVANILGLAVLWIGIFVVMSLLVLLLLPAPAPGEADTQIVTAVSAVAACQNNIGPGFGRVGAAANYAWMPPAPKALLILSMLLGRLEVYSVLVVLLPLAWRR
jgi:trk system potassium uptake protein TrkH